MAILFVCSIMNRSHRISDHVNYKVAQSLPHNYNQRGEEVASRHKWVMIVMDGDAHVELCYDSAQVLSMTMPTTIYIWLCVIFVCRCTHSMCVSVQLVSPSNDRRDTGQA